MNASPPTLLVLTDDCISPSHGTGAALLRHLKEFPPETLWHGFLNLKGDPYLPNSRQVLIDESRARPWYRRWIPRAPNASTPAVSAREFVRGLPGHGTGIDIVYANTFGELGLQLIEELLRELPQNIPLVYHAQDILYENRRHFETMLQRVSSRVAEFWAIGPAIGEEVKRITGREFRLMTPFQIDIHPIHKTEHRPFSAESTAVMLGNSHMPWCLHHLRSVWASIGKDVDGLQPIQWYAYPSSVTYVKNAGVEFEPEIEYYGFLNDRVLHEHLCAADFAIVPFNIEDRPEYHYAEFSIPSRITEFMNAGLPIFAAAGRETDACRFIESNGIGVCATLADEDTFRDRLLAFARDIDRRRELGEAGRRFAESHCDIRTYRTGLLHHFNEILAGARLCPPDQKRTR